MQAFFKSFEIYNYPRERERENIWHRTRDRSAEHVTDQLMHATEHVTDQLILDSEHLTNQLSLGYRTCDRSADAGRRTRD